LQNTTSRILLLVIQLALTDRITINPIRFDPEKALLVL